MSKLFDNMAKLKFKDDDEGNATKEALGMFSKEGEYVDFDKTCDCSGQVNYSYSSPECLMGVATLGLLQHTQNIPYYVVSLLQLNLKHPWVEKQVELENEILHCFSLVPLLHAWLFLNRWLDSNARCQRTMFKRDLLWPKRQRVWKCRLKSVIVDQRIVYPTFVSKVLVESIPGWKARIRRNFFKANPHGFFSSIPLLFVSCFPASKCSLFSRVPL